MKHFVFVKSANDSDANWGLALENATLREVRDHMDNRAFYKNPTDWIFLVIKGRKLPVAFQAVVKF